MHVHVHVHVCVCVWREEGKGGEGRRGKGGDERFSTDAWIRGTEGNKGEIRLQS